MPALPAVIMDPALEYTEPALPAAPACGGLASPASPPSPASAVPSFAENFWHAPSIASAAKASDPKSATERDRIGARAFRLVGIIDSLSVSANRIPS